MLWTEWSNLGVAFECVIVAFIVILPLFDFDRMFVGQNERVCLATWCVCLFLKKYVYFWKVFRFVRMEIDFTAEWPHRRYCTCGDASSRSFFLWMVEKGKTFDQLRNQRVNIPVFLDSLCGAYRYAVFWLSCACFAWKFWRLAVWRDVRTPQLPTSFVRPTTKETSINSADDWAKLRIYEHRVAVYCVKKGLRAVINMSPSRST